MLKTNDRDDNNIQAVSTTGVREAKDGQDENPTIHTSRRWRAEQRDLFRPCCAHGKRSPDLDRCCGQHLAG